MKQNMLPTYYQINISCICMTTRIMMLMRIGQAVRLSGNYPFRVILIVTIVPIFE